jgi:spermidine/putrescine transport system permease protein
VRQSRFILLVISVVLFLFLYAPIVAVFVQSFNAAKLGVQWQGFTTNWYRLLTNNESTIHAAVVTLILGGASTAFSTALGTWLAMGLSRGKFRGKSATESFLQTVIVVPDIVMAIGLLLFYAVIRNWLEWLEPGLLTMTVAHVTFQIPFVTLIVRARLAGLDSSLAEAARDLGANSWQTFRHVTLPLIWPGILAGALLAFTLSLDDFVISFFTAGPGSTTLPILIYSSVKRGVTPEIHALSTLMTAVSILTAITVMWLQSRKGLRVIV